MLLMSANLDGPGRQAAAAPRGIDQWPSMDYVKLPWCTWTGAAGTHSGSPTLAQPVYMKALHSMVHTSPCLPHLAARLQTSEKPPPRRCVHPQPAAGAAGGPPLRPRHHRRSPMGQTESQSVSSSVSEGKRSKHHTTPNCKLSPYKLCPLNQRDVGPGGKSHHLTDALT